MSNATTMKDLLQVFVDAAKEAGDKGLVSGILYAHVMGFMNLGQFNTVLAVLVETGHLRKEGFVYYWVKDIE